MIRSTRSNTWAGILRLGLATAGAIVTAVTIDAAFPNALNNPPAGWTGPVFKLSQAYPATRPNLEPPSKRKWAQFNFKNATDAPKYLQAVLDYCLEGNRENDFADVSQNPVRKWYHAPWLHSTNRGREFIRGLTKERPSAPPELGPAHTSDHDNWAVGFYNARGAFTIGQVWKDPQHPDPRKAIFPSHTVTCKLLFTTAPLTEVPLSIGPFRTRFLRPRCSCWPRAVLIHCSCVGWSALRRATSLPHIKPTGTMCSHQLVEVDAAFSY